MGCAFLSFALLSFDVFPWCEVPYMPPRPMYPLACTGMLLFLISGQWVGRLREHTCLLVLCTVLLSTGFLSTWIGLERGAQALAPAVLLGFLRWFAIPLGF